MLGRAAVGLALVLGLSLDPTNVAAQVARSTPAIDTVIIVTRKVFTPEQAEASGVFRGANAFHVVTKEEVIRKDLLFQAGDPYDPVKLAESERLLRARELFQVVDIDTMSIDGRLAVIVDTQDGWSTKPAIGITVASDGTLTGHLGLSELNLLGSGNLAHFSYVKETDRKGPRLSADFRRLFGTQLGVAGSVNFWNDGTVGFWRFGDPWTSDLDRRAFLMDGDAASGRVLQYRVEDPAMPDTTFYQRDALINRLRGALAPLALPRGHLRLGAGVGVRQEQYILQQDTGQAIPDTVYGEFGVSVEYSRSRYQKVSYFNGFADEDIDVSARVKLQLNLAASGLGYQRTGIGPSVEATIGTQSASMFVLGTLTADGLFTDAGLDSGRVILDLTIGIKPAPRHSTVIYASAGALENPPPGQEFDLGFEQPPRSWQPHSFVGTRTLWGTIEHRWFAWEGLAEIISLGPAVFVDYGGAWYADQDPRFGGNVGIGLRMGSALGTTANTTRIDFGCRIGSGSDVGDRCVMTLGAGFVFPWNPAAGDMVEKI